MNWLRPLFLGLALLAGCAGSALYDESDNKRSVDADLGTSFTVSLVDPGETRAKPVFSPSILELAKESRDESGRRRLLTFTARNSGETEIRVGPDYSLRVRVVSASDRPGMHVHTR
ncbi:MAG: hypothetical protein HY293_08640 [Planctomycetes bacterium]|nr:hypothetical protein [Planctomycetota bacterium]